MNFLSDQIVSPEAEYLMEQCPKEYKINRNLFEF